MTEASAQANPSLSAPSAVAERASPSRDASQARTTAQRLRISRGTIVTTLYVLLALFASMPAWIVRFPPLQDLPFHTSTLRIIHDFHTPEFGFDRELELALDRTPYVFYYILGSALAHVMGVANANITLIVAYLAGTPLALRALLRALGKDERLSILIIPLLVNEMFMMGLLPFMFGIPVMFLALALTVRYFERLTGNAEARRTALRDGLLLSALCLVLFFSHVFPFGLFALGFVILFPWLHPRLWIRAGLPALPTMGALAWWLGTTESGKIALGAANADASERPVPLDQAMADMHLWLNDAFKDTTDELWFLVWCAVAVLALGLSQGDAQHGDRERPRPLARRFVLLPLACFLLYFVTPQSRGPVWLFSQRFPILMLMTAIPILRFPRGWRGGLVLVAALGVAIGSTLNVCAHFRAFERDEVGDIDEALAAIPPNRRVASLIFDKESKIVRWAPFLHFGAYYQFRKGGIVQFSYAGYAHWPYTYKPDHFPPQPGLPSGPARRYWEWRPETISAKDELYPYFDYVLTRGAGFAPPPGTFHVDWQGQHWTVWKRD
jgi:hypothetical protein